MLIDSQSISLSSKWQVEWKYFQIDYSNQIFPMNTLVKRCRWGCSMFIEKKTYTLLECIPENLKTSKIVLKLSIEIESPIKWYLLVTWASEFEKENFVASVLEKSCSIFITFCLVLDSLKWDFNIPLHLFFFCWCKNSHAKFDTVHFFRDENCLSRLLQVSL